jgi:hypothetical protein
VAAPTPRAHAPHLDGVVASVTDGSITITDHVGFNRTIHLSDATTYGDGISLPVEVGEHVHAEGTVDTDGTSLAATVIARRQKRQGEVPAVPSTGDAPDTDKPTN